MMGVSEEVQHESFVPGAVDEQGNESDSWADPVPRWVIGFDPGGTSEPFTPGHNRVITEPTIYAPPDVVFNPRDRVTVRGRLYEVVGDTAEWRHPNGWVPGNVIELNRVDG